MSFIVVLQQSPTWLKARFKRHAWNKMDNILIGSRRRGSVKDVVTTNGGATTLQNTGIDNPAAKVLVEISQAQDNGVAGGNHSTGIYATSGAVGDMNALGIEEAYAAKSYMVRTPSTTYVEEAMLDDAELLALSHRRESPAFVPELLLGAGAAADELEDTLAQSAAMALRSRTLTFTRSLGAGAHAADGDVHYVGYGCMPDMKYDRYVLPSKSGDSPPPTSSNSVLSSPPSAVITAALKQAQQETRVAKDWALTAEAENDKIDEQYVTLCSEKIAVDEELKRVRLVRNNLEEELHAVRQQLDASRMEAAKVPQLEEDLAHAKRMRTLISESRDDCSDCVTRLERENDKLMDVNNQLKKANCALKNAKEQLEIAAAADRANSQQTRFRIHWLEAQLVKQRDDAQQLLLQQRELFDSRHEQQQEELALLDEKYVEQIRFRDDADRRRLSLEDKLEQQFLSSWEFVDNDVQYDENNEIAAATAHGPLFSSPPRPYSKFVTSVLRFVCGRVSSGSSPPPAAAPLFSPTKRLRTDADDSDEEGQAAQKAGSSKKIKRMQ